MCTSAWSPEKSSNGGLGFVSKIVQIPGAKNSFLPKSSCKYLLKLHSAFGIPKDIVYQPYSTSLLLQTTANCLFHPNTTLVCEGKKNNHLIRIKLTEEYSLPPSSPLAEKKSICDKSPRCCSLSIWSTQVEVILVNRKLSSPIHLTFPYGLCYNSVAE